MKNSLEFRPHNTLQPYHHQLPSFFSVFLHYKNRVKLKRLLCLIMAGARAGALLHNQIEISKLKSKNVPRRAETEEIVLNEVFFALFSFQRIFLLCWCWPVIDIYGLPCFLNETIMFAVKGLIMRWNMKLLSKMENCLRETVGNREDLPIRKNN